MKKIDDLTGGRIAFFVRVTPRASKNAIVGWTEEGQLKILVSAPPVDDAANRQLIKLVSKALDIPKTNIEISSGSRSRTKRITVGSAAKNRLLSFSDI
jgi:uncharacterized protein (TIGR00251 family)